MLARQHCLQQARRVNVGRSLYPARVCAAAPPSQLQSRSLATRARPTIVGTAAVVNIDNVPTILPVKDPLKHLDKNLSIRLTKEYKQYLQNPYNLGNSVRRRLAKGDFEEAVSLVRIATKDGQAVVSWNLLVEHLFKEQKLHAAIKLFNEMKKRGQLPNAQTYTTIFKGCARSQHAKTAVSEAVRIYMTMLTSPRLPPNIIHVNAVLEVCARALDVEAMMSVAATIDDKSRKADSVTYATLLHGLRASIDAEAGQLPHAKKNGFDPEVHAALVEKVLEQSKRIWQEVIQRWRAGYLVLDEGLVFAMGRILLLGDRSDALSVFDLLEQTMRIPNLEKQAASRLGERSGEPSSEKPKAADGAASAGPPVQTFPPADKKSGLYPTPTTKTLALALNVMQHTRRVHVALAYWRLLTEEYKVAPDSNNWASILHILRRSHSSSQVVSILEAMPPSLMQPKTFRVAFTACLRDNVNPQVLQNANAVLGKMLATLPKPDLECLRTYLDVATTSHHQFRLQKRKGGDAVALDAAFGEQIVGALEKIWKPDAFPACRAELVAKLAAAGRASGRPPPPRDTDDPSTSSSSSRGGHFRGAAPAAPPRDVRAEARLYAAELVALMRRAVAAWDRVITERLLPEDRLASLRPRRDAVNGLVSSYFTALRDAGEPDPERAADEADGLSLQLEGRGEAAGKGKGSSMPRRGRGKFTKGDEDKLIRDLLKVVKDSTI